MATRPSFGIDAPGVVRNLALIGLALFLVAGLGHLLHQPDMTLALSPALSFTICSGLMLVCSLVTKPIVTRWMIAKLALRGDEQVLDVGCGRGLLLLEVARHLPSGRAVGLDLWSTRDQSGNAAAATLRNAEIAGVAARISIDTGDMRAMPYPDASFDAIVSSLAIHNLPSTVERAQTVSEIARVLKPGGRLALLDFRNTPTYARSLRAAGLEVRHSWPILLMFPPVWIVWARKPDPAR